MSTEQTPDMENIQVNLVMWEVPVPVAKELKNLQARVDELEEALREIIAGCVEEDALGALHYDDLDFIANKALTENNDD